MIDIFHTHISQEAIDLVNLTLKSGFLNYGPISKTLEKTLESFLGYPNPVLTNSCTSSLHLALELSDVKDKEVLIPSQSFIASSLAILYAGGIPVFCDVNKTGNINIEDLTKKITDNTKAIVVVYWASNPLTWLETNTILELAKQHNLKVIADSAHNFGGYHFNGPDKVIGNSIPVGTEFDFGCYSYQCIKMVPGGDAGLLTCKNQDDYNKAKKMIWFGMDRNFTRNEIGEREVLIDTLGYKYHINDLTSSLILGNLVDLQDRINRRKKIYTRYKEIKLDGIEILEHNNGSVHWLCNCLVENRLEFVRKLKSENINASIVDGRMDKHPIFGDKRDLVGQNYLDEHLIHIPNHEGLTDDQVEHIIKVIESGW